VRAGARAAGDRHRVRDRRAAARSGYRAAARRTRPPCRTGGRGLCDLARIGDAAGVTVTSSPDDALPSAEETSVTDDALPSAEETGVTALAAATPDTRDRYVDFLRVLSICAVIVGHWLLSMLTLYGAGDLSFRLPFELITWVLQVM